MTDLVERESELTEIDVFVRRGGVMLIEAGAGVGKTSLLDATCALARRAGRMVLRARGSDLERDFAFGIARQLFERRCADATADERRALLAGPARPVVTLFRRDDSGSGEQDTGFAVLHGLYWLAMNLADSVPLLLAVDDAQWADEASARWLAYLAPRLDGPAVALVVVLRPDEPTARSQPLVALRAAATTAIRPSLLSRQGVATVVRDTLGSGTPDDVGTLAHRATGGNPFYLREFLTRPGTRRSVERAARDRGRRRPWRRRRCGATAARTPAAPQPRRAAPGAGARDPRRRLRPSARRRDRGHRHGSGHVPGDGSGAARGPR
jgi:hypothetical protein